MDERKCDIDDDCMATCGYGCMNEEIFWNKMESGNFADCEAIPEYKCVCADGYCQKK